LKNKLKTMEEIKEMYEKIMDKKSFRENLSKALFLNVRTVENSLLCRGKFKDKHIVKVKQCLTIQLKIDEKVKDMNIKAWKLI